MTRHDTKRCHRSPKTIRRMKFTTAKKWKQIFSECQLFDNCAAAQKLNPEISERTIQRRFKRWKSEQNNQLEPHQCLSTINNYGKHSQSFTPEQELVLAANIHSIINSHVELVSYQTVRAMAIDYYNFIHSKDRTTRSVGIVPFKASNGWIERFKARHGFIKRKPKIKKKITEHQILTHENDLITYSLMIEEAVNKYGADYVMNMDETPAKICEQPLSGWSNIDNDNLEIISDGNTRAMITILPTITANGNKLDFGWIHSAKTYKAILEMLSIPREIKSYFSDSGWINNGIMLRYLREIVWPYIGNHPAALILDDYKAHWTEDVLELAASMNLELIQVPRSTTSRSQPLDLTVNGPMKQKRTQLWIEERANGILTTDNIERTVTRAYKAYQLIDRNTIKKGWFMIAPVLEHQI
jgi:hypothetical protein